MKDFDRIIDNQFGIIFGRRNLVFLKTDKGEDIYGPENKYLEICLSLAKHNGCTYVVSANQDEADLLSEIERIDKVVEYYDQIYYIGISDGGLIGAKQCWMVDAIRDAYLLNVTLSLEDNFKDILNGIQKFQGNLMEFKFGDQDPSYTSAWKIEDINKTSIKCNKYIGEGHVFDTDTLEFSIYVFLNKQMYTREKYTVTGENIFAYGAVVTAYDEARDDFYRKKNRVIYLYGEKGCGKTHLLNMLLNNNDEGIRIELDDAEEVYDYEEFILGYHLNDIAMIDNINCLDSEGIKILKEVLKFSYLDKKVNSLGPIMILTSSKSPEETFTDKELVSIIRQGEVVEINRRGGTVGDFYKTKWTDEKEKKILDLINSLIIGITRDINVFTPEANNKISRMGCGDMSEIDIDELMIDGTLIIEDGYKVKSGKENEYCEIIINKSLKNPFWGEVRYYVDDKQGDYEEYETYEDFLKCIKKISKCEPFDLNYIPCECTSTNWLAWRSHVRVEKEETGLPYDLILATSYLPRNITKEPNLCIVYGSLLVPIMIEKNPRIKANNEMEIPDVDDVLNWVSDHYLVLLQHWNKEITDREVLNELAVDC